MLPQNYFDLRHFRPHQSAASTLRFGKVVVLQRCRELTGPLISKVGYAVALKEAASIGDMMIMNP